MIKKKILHSYSLWWAGRISITDRQNRQSDKWLRVTVICARISISPSIFLNLLRGVKTHWGHLERRCGYTAPLKINKIDTLREKRRQKMQSEQAASWQQWHMRKVPRQIWIYKSAPGQIGAPNKSLVEKPPQCSLSLSIIKAPSFEKGLAWGFVTLCYHVNSLIRLLLYSQFWLSSNYCVPSD